MATPLQQVLEKVGPSLVEAGVSVAVAVVLAYFSAWSVKWLWHAAHDAREHSYERGTEAEDMDLVPIEKDYSYAFSEPRWGGIDDADVDSWDLDIDGVRSALRD